MPTYEVDVYIKYCTSYTVIAEDEDEAVGKAYDHFSDTKIIIDEDEYADCEVVGVERID